MTWASVNEMHLPSAVGTTVELNLHDDVKKATAQLHVVDAGRGAEGRDRRLQGRLARGKKLNWAMEKAGGKNVRRVTELLWNRLSLVDRPSTPTPP